MRRRRLPRSSFSSVAFTLNRYGHLYEDHEDRVTERLEAMITNAQPAAEGDVRRLR